MPAASRTIAVPVRRGVSSTAWQPKNPLDVLTYTVDASAWLADAGTQITDYRVETDAGLIVTNKGLVGNPPTGVSFTVGGGISGQVYNLYVWLEMLDGERLFSASMLPVSGLAPSIHTTPQSDPGLVDAGGPVGSLPGPGPVPPPPGTLGDSSGALFDQQGPIADVTKGAR